MGKPQGRTIPVHHEKQTLEEKRHHLVDKLHTTYKKQRRHDGSKTKNEKALSNISSHANQLATGQWFDQLNRWIAETPKWWSHDMNRMWRNMFSLVPVEDIDLDPWSTFGNFDTPGYISAILSRMDRQMETLRRQMDKLIPDYSSDLVDRAERGCQDAMLPRGGWGGHKFDYLHDAYEPGEDGQLRFKLRFDLRGYGPEDVRVDASKNRLTVHAKKTEESDGAMQRREFCRTLYVPDKVDVDNFTSSLSQDGVLTVEAPVKQQNEVGAIKYDRERQLGIEPSSESSSDSDKALVPMDKPGVTVLSDGASCTGSRLHVEVPVEDGYKPCELHVSTVGNQLVVSGRHETKEDFGSRGGNFHVREFQRSYTIPESVDPLSLKAKFYEDKQVLIAEAPLLSVTRSVTS